MYYEAIDRWNSQILAHHGVKGMKWGIRHDRLKKKTDDAFNRLQLFDETHEIDDYSNKVKGEKARRKLIKKANKLLNKYERTTAKQFNKALNKNENAYISDTEKKLNYIGKANARFNKMKKFGSKKKDILSDAKYKELMQEATKYNVSANQYRRENSNLMKQAKAEGLDTSYTRDTYRIGPGTMRTAGLLYGAGHLAGGPIVGGASAGLYLGIKTNHDLAGFGARYTNKVLNEWGDTPTGILTQTYTIKPKKRKK